MDKLEELEEELVRLKTIEADIIDRMRIMNISTNERIILLCKLEVIRYDIAPIYKNFINKIRNGKEKVSNG